MNDRTKNTCIAVGAAVFIPAVMLLQQFLLPRGKEPVPRHLEWRIDGKLMLATEDGLKQGRKYAWHVANAAAGYITQRRYRTAEAWLKWGAAEQRFPSIMLFYGDYLVSVKRYREALRWYRLAEKQAAADGQLAFAKIVRGRIGGLAAAMKRKGGK